MLVFSILAPVYLCLDSIVRSHIGTSAYSSTYPSTNELRKSLLTKRSQLQIAALKNDTSNTTSVTTAALVEPTSPVAVAPVAHAVAPVAQAVPPVAQAVAPVAQAVAPVAQAVAPIAQTVAPVAPAVAPVAPAVAPASPVVAPASPVVAPLAQIVDPVFPEMTKQIPTAIAPVLTNSPDPNNQIYVEGHQCKMKFLVSNKEVDQNGNWKSNEQGNCHCPVGYACMMDSTKKLIRELVGEIQVQDPTVTNGVRDMQDHTKFEVGCPALTTDRQDWFTSYRFFTHRTQDVICVELLDGEEARDIVDIYFLGDQDPFTPAHRGNGVTSSATSAFLSIIVLLLF